MERLKMLEEIWEVMLGVFGNAFVNNHGEAPNPVWAMAIEGVSDYKLKSALEKIVRGESRFLDYAPTAPAFAAFAKSMSAEPVSSPEPLRLTGKVLDKAALEANAKKAQEEIKSFLAFMKKEGRLRIS